MVDYTKPQSPGIQQQPVQQQPDIFGSMLQGMEFAGSLIDTYRDSKSRRIVNGIMKKNWEDLTPEDHALIGLHAPGLGSYMAERSERLANAKRTNQLAQQEGILFALNMENRNKTQAYKVLGSIMKSNPANRQQIWDAFGESNKDDPGMLKVMQAVELFMVDPATGLPDWSDERVLAAINFTSTDAQYMAKELADIEGKHAENVALINERKQIRQDDVALAIALANAEAKKYVVDKEAEYKVEVAETNLKGTYDTNTANIRVQNLINEMDEKELKVQSNRFKAFADEYDGTAPIRDVARAYFLTHGKTFDPNGEVNPGYENLDEQTRIYMANDPEFIRNIDGMFSDPYMTVDEYFGPRTDKPKGNEEAEADLNALAQPEQSQDATPTIGGQTGETRPDTFTLKGGDFEPSRLQDPLRGKKGNEWQTEYGEKEQEIFKNVFDNLGSNSQIMPEFSEKLEKYYRAGMLRIEKDPVDKDYYTIVQVRPGIKKNKTIARFFNKKSLGYRLVTDERLGYGFAED